MIQIEESNPSFESCSDCIYSDDSEETCILRRCIHAVAQLNECYVPKQRKRGHWIQISPAGIYECSECGQYVMTSDIDVYDFCHRCGAEMGD